MTNQNQLEGKSSKVARFRPFNNPWWFEGFGQFEPTPDGINAAVDVSLTVDSFLNRLDEDLEKKLLPKNLNISPYVDTDAVYTSLYADIRSVLDDVKKRYTELNHSENKDLQKLLLMMFKLGSLVESSFLQDLVLRGRESAVQKARAAYQRDSDRSFRREAYECALKQAGQSGYKVTCGGLKAYLKSLPDAKFETGIEGCSFISLQKNGFVDAIGKYSDRSVSVAVSALTSK